MPDVFVNYRTADARFGAAATYELLAGKFGKHRVFLDNQSIPPGTPYVAELDNALESMRVLLVLIGPTWLGTDGQTDGGEASTPCLLDRPTDWVRREIRRALKRGVPIIPVLLDGTTIPDTRLLPPDIRPLVRYQAMEVRHHRLGADVGRLADRLAMLIPPELSPASAGSPTPLPQQLPARLPGFVGRRDELGWLDHWLQEKHDDAPRIVVLCGAPGVGKTTLATHWAHRVQEHFPDGVLDVNLRGFDHRGALDPAEALHGLLAALGIPSQAVPDTVDDRSALLRSSLTNRQVLLLLDNAHTAEQIRPLLPGAQTCRVVVTSRTRLDGLTVREGARHITVDVLGKPEAHLLLNKRIATGRLTAEPATAEEIVDWCAGLPLALSMVAALADQRQGPLSQIVHELGNERTRLGGLALGDEDLDLRSIFSWSYQRLSPPARTLFRLIGIHPGPDISRHSCICLGQNEHTRRALDELVRSNLLTEHAPGRYSFHDLLRIYAGEQAHRDTTESERHTLRTRIADHYLHHLTAAAHWLDPSTTDTLPRPPEVAAFTGDTNALSWCEAEHATLLAVIELSARHALDSHIWRIASMSNGFLRRTGRPHERITVHRAAVDAAARAGNRLAWATSSRALASALARLGRYDEARAHLEEALPVLQSAHDRLGLLQAHLSYTRVLDAQQKYNAALRHAQTALDLADPNKGAVSHADALINLGHQLTKLNRHTEALPACTEALLRYQALEHREGQSSCLLTMGMIHQALRDYPTAISCYERSCTLDRQLGDQYWEALCLERLGEVHLLLGRQDTALLCWREALTLLDSLHHPEAVHLRERVARPIHPSLLSSDQVSRNTPPYS